jgi:predicted nuclease of restriction endonuclease-like (RecB) superfamily
MPHQEVDLLLTKEYAIFLKEIKAHVKSTRIKAALALNKEAIQMYWQVGKSILEKQKQTQWGDKLLTHLSTDLRHAFPEMRGFSVTNLKYMRILAHFYPVEIGQQSVDQLPWGHIVLLLRIKDPIERQWYIQACIQEGWSRDMFKKQMESQLYKRQGLTLDKVSNYLTRLPSPQSELAHELLKNPYNLDCLGLHDDAQEKAIEHASVQHITKFLLEIGKGFAFVGHQVPIEVDDKEYLIDILLYHVKLHAYTVVELKATSFKPAHAGQLNFYISAVDDKLRTEGDGPTMGLLLCKSRSKVVAEYALRGIERPIGVSEYQLTKALPDNLKTNLPTIQEIEAELNFKEDED